MGALDSLKDFYAQLEDGYYSMLDRLEEMKIPVYKAVDFFEKRNIPSFPVFIALIALFILGLFFAAGSFGGANVEVLVQDEAGNPVFGAQVVATSNGKTVDLQATTSDGKAVLKTAPGTETEFSVSKTGYEDSTFTLSPSPGGESRVVTLSAQAFTITKTIQLLEAGTQRSYDSPIQVQISCTGNDFSEIVTSVDGQIEIEVESDCDTLQIVPVSAVQLSGATVSLSSTESRLFVQAGATGSGGAIATISDAQGKTVSGIDVTLYSATSTGATGSAFQTAQSSSAGTATFNAVPSGRYYIVTYDRTGNYSEYDGKVANNTQDVRNGEISSFAVVLSASSAGKVRVQLKDKATGEAVAGAQVRLTKGTTEITSQYTDTTGRIEFSVGEDVLYSVTADKQGYLIANFSTRPTADFQIISLEQATVENSQSLLVTVLDENDRSVEGVRLKLKNNSDGSQVGSEITTGLDGKAIFGRIVQGAYYVYAVKPGYGEKTSDTINVSNRQQNILSMKLPIGSGNLGVLAVDEDGKVIAGADIKVVDAAALQSITDETTDSDGKKTISIRADKKVFLIASADGFVSTTSAPLQMQKDVTLEKRVTLYRNVQSFAVDFDGLYVGDESVLDSGGSLDAGQTYTAKLRMLVPKNATYDEAGVHIRTGSDSSDSIEKDFLYVAGVNAAYTSLVRGTGYNPPTGQSTDFSRLTSGNAKWANILFRRAQGGVYEIEAQVQVRDEAKIGSLLEIWYRAWAKSGGYLRAPNDATLGTSENVTSKQGLYANSSKKTYSIGPTSLCGDDFCANYSIEDLRENLSSGVFDNYTAQISGRYKLNFEISSISQTSFGAAALSVKDRTGGIVIESYNIKTAGGETRTENKSSSEITVPVGSVGRDSVVSGEIVFSARKEGTIPLQIAIASGAGTQSQVYTKQIAVKILPANKLGLDIVPRIIVPLINNNLLIRVTADGSVNTISNAKVSIAVNGALIASGETDAEGIFAYALNSPSDGSTITVSAQKTGYQETAKETKVSGNLLVTEPPVLRLAINVGGKEFNTLSAILKNYSQVPLQIESIAASKDFEGFATIQFGEPTDGTILLQDSNADITASIKLGQKGKAISQPLKITGSVMAKLSNPNFPQKWVAQIPLELNIGFGDEVDDAGCFSVFPGEWKIFGKSSDRSETTINLKNDCSVGGEKVILKNISARIVSADSLNGTYTATSTLEGSSAVQLDKVFRRVADNLQDDSEGSIKVSFKSDDIVSASSTGFIEIRASHFTQTGEQKLTGKVNLTTNITNLAQCVEVLAQQDLTVNSCPSNLGYGNYGTGQNFNSYSSRYGGFDPNATYNQGGYGAPFLNGGLNNISQQSYYNPSTYGSYYGTTYPNNSYNYPFYPGQGQNLQFSNQWACNSASFKVRNNCASPVALSFEAQPGISVNQSTVKVTPNAEAEVQVNATNFFGRYNLTVRGKVDSSSEKSTDLRTISVNVVNEYAKDYRDCISVDPARTIEFNDLVQGPKIIKIRNSCFNQGVFIPDGPSAVNFIGSTVSNPSDPFNTAQTQAYLNTPPATTMRSGVPVTAQRNTPAASPVAGTQNIPMIQSWAYVTTTQETDSRGNTVQIVQFEVAKNINAYANYAPAADFFSANEFKDIGNLRYFLTRGFHAVQGRTIMVVNFTTPYGSSRSTTFPMIVQDYFNAAPYLENITKQFDSYGDPSISPQDCINQNALNFGAPWSYKGTFSTAADSPNGPLFKISRENDETSGRRVQSKACGSVDKISDPFRPTAFTDKSSGMKATITHDGHEALVVLDRSGWDCSKEAVFDESFDSRVTRVSPSVTRPVQFRLQLRIRAEPDNPNCKQTQPGGQGGTPGQTPPGQLLTCTNGNGTSGSAAFTAYGFQHFSFDWRVADKSGKNGVSINSCDATTANGTTRGLNVAGAAPLFCDALQSSLSIAQKFAELKKASPLSTEGTVACLPQSGFICDNSSNMTSANLYRYLLAQEIVERSDGKIEVMFTDQQRELLDISSQIVIGNAEAKKAIDSLKGKDVKDAPDIDFFKRLDADISSIAGALRGKMPAGAELDYEFSMETDSGKELARYLKSVYSLTERKTTIGGKITYLMPLDGYARFSNHIATQCSAANTVECRLSIPNITPTGAILTLKLADMQEFIKNGKWKILALNSASMDPVVRDAVMKAGSWSESSKLRVGGTYTNFYEFRTQNIAPLMYLQKDSFTTSSAKLWDVIAANNEYKDKLKGITGEDVPTQIDFATPSVEAGEYAAELNYNWAEKKYSVLFKSNNKRPADISAGYANNPLFDLPIDGKLGWGTMFSGEPSLILKNYSSNDVFNLAEKKGTGKAFSKVSSYASDATRGRVLKIGSDGVVYSPVDPIKLTIDVTKAANQKAGVIYKFSVDQMQTPLAISMKQTGTLSNQQTIALSEIAANQLCTNLDGSYSGIVYSGSTAGNSKLTGMIFTPSRGTTVANNWTLAQQCVQGTVSAKTYDALTKSDITGSATSPAVQLLTGSETAKSYTLSWFLDQVSKDNICVKNADNSLELYWNEEQLLK